MNAEINNTENADFQDANRSNFDLEPESYILTQEQVDEQIKNEVAPISKQLEDLTRVIQRMTAPRPQQLNPTARTTARFASTGTLTVSSDSSLLASQQFVKHKNNLSNPSL